MVDKYAQYATKKMSATQQTNRRYQPSQQKPPKITEIRFHKNIGENDLDVKLNKIKESLMKKHQVKLRLQLIGREKSKPMEGVEWLMGIVEKFTEISTPNRVPTPDNLVVILFPKNSAFNNKMVE